MTRVLLPIATADLVANQGVSCGCIGNAQERFRQAHQRNTLLAGQRKFLHQTLHAPRTATRAWPFSHALNQTTRQRIGFLGSLWA